MKHKVEAKLLVTREEAADYLASLVQTLRDGTLHLQSGEEEITLAPSEQVSVKMKASAKEEKQKFELSLSWRDAASLSADDVVLTSEAPEREEDNDDEDDEGKETKGADGDGVDGDGGGLAAVDAAAGEAAEGGESSPAATG